MESRENLLTVRTDLSWQEEVAEFLLHAGLRPSETIGQVQHAADSRRTGRTFGSVWRAMRTLEECGQARAAEEIQN
jgi:hypothetical protein